MPLDPNIPLQIGQPVQPLDPLKAYGSVLTLKNLIDQQQMNGLQMQQAQRAADKEMRLSDLARRSGGDEAAFLNGYREVDPLGAIDLGIRTRKAGFEQSKMEREAEKAKYEMLGKRIELVAQGIGSLPENPTYEQVVGVSRWLNTQGVQHDENEIPKDPSQLPAYMQQKRMQALSAEKQFSELAPKSKLGELFQDQERDQARTAALQEQQYGSEITGQGGRDANGNLVAPGVKFTAPPDRYAAAIARETYGPADAPFRYGPTGKVEGVPEVQNFQRTKAREGATVLNIDNKQQEASAKQIGEDYGKRFGEIQRAEFSSRAMTTKLTRLNQILQDVDTGKLTPLGTQIAGYARSLGFDIDPKLGNKEAAMQLESMIALDFAEKMKGPLSDSDRRFVQSISSMTDKSTKARALQVETMKRLAERDAQMAKMARDYKKKHGKFDEGFDDEMALWSTQNPLFPDMNSIDAELKKRGQ